MNLKLTRTRFNSNGVFGVLSDGEGNRIAYTLEHAYPGTQVPVSYIPKLPPGTYECIRGLHQLKRSPRPFETFEITDVPGHAGILFHAGNTNEDSDGCVLLGSSLNGVGIGFSKDAFDRFLALQDGVTEFTLTVV